MVSVIVPNYNHANFLEARLTSIINQSYNDLEIIFLDDASTDNSLDIAKNFQAKDSRIRIISNEKNSGSPFKQWQLGIIEAKGDYIWIAESDDYADTKLLHTLLPIFKESPKVNLAYCQSIIVNQIGDPLFSAKKWTDDLDRKLFEESFTLNGQDYITRFLQYRCTIPNASAVVFRKKAITPHLSSMTKYKYAGDWSLYLDMLENGNIYFNAKALNFFRRSHNSVTTIGKKGHEQFQEHLNIHLRAFRTLGDKSGKDKILDYYINEILDSWQENKAFKAVPLKKLLLLLKNDKKFIKRTLSYFKHKLLHE